MSAIELEDVAKTYDRVRYVLDGLSLTVEPGQVVSIMGRSGVGKTTLLNLVAGLETPTRGRIRVAGTDLSTLDDDERTRFRRDRVGVVFQRFHLIPELTVAENVRLPMRLAKRADAATRTKTLLRFFGIEELADAFPATLSGGETQRTAIARALANEPSVVLADEPTANLDEENAKTALAELRRVAKELTTAVLIASHDPLARGAGDRVYQMAAGRLEPVTRPPKPTQGAAGAPSPGTPPSGQETPT